MAASSRKERAMAAAAAATGGGGGSYAGTSGGRSGYHGGGGGSSTSSATTAPGSHQLRIYDTAVSKHCRRTRQEGMKRERKKRMNEFIYEEEAPVTHHRVHSLIVTTLRLCMYILKLT
eukprot:GHVU01018156.1.p2 GENE.GHVU01018156.1~~GHVU01018156.1.p2  ORF type:complete len:118 (-),score=19.62 GHVU01018156.1:110-463(-)